MNFNGDEADEVAMNAEFSKLVAEDTLNLQEKMLAADYFKWAWEAAKEFYTNRPTGQN